MLQEFLRRTQRTCVDYGHGTTPIFRNPSSQSCFREIRLSIQNTKCNKSRTYRPPNRNQRPFSRFKDLKDLKVFSDFANFWPTHKSAIIIHDHIAPTYTPKSASPCDSGQLTRKPVQWGRHIRGLPCMYKSTDSYRRIKRLGITGYQDKQSSQMKS